MHAADKGYQDVVARVPNGRGKTGLD